MSLVCTWYKWEKEIILGNQLQKPLLTRFILCSYPKSGRTWLRFILANYLNHIFELNLDLDFWNLFTLLPNGGRDPQKGLPVYQFSQRPDIPLITSSHAFWHNRFKNQNIIFLIRSPSDLLVSYYCHLSYGMDVYHQDISDFLRDPQVGVASLIIYLNQWSQHLDLTKNHILSYEQMQSQLDDTVAGIIKFIGLPLQKKALYSAIEAASFHNMRALETTKGAPWLCANTENPDALRTRRGIVTNHNSYLTPEDLIYIEQQCELKLTKTTKQLLAKVDCSIQKSNESEALLHN